MCPHSHPLPCLSCPIAPSSYMHSFSPLFLKVTSFFSPCSWLSVLLSASLLSVLMENHTAPARVRECITCLLAVDDIMALAVGGSGSIRRAPQQTGPLSTFNTAPLLIQPRTSESRSGTQLVWRFSKKQSLTEKERLLLWFSTNAKDIRYANSQICANSNRPASYGCAVLQYMSCVS